MDNNPKKMFTDHQHKGKESDAKINRKIEFREAQTLQRGGTRCHSAA
jgi:hypothetical protein